MNLWEQLHQLGRQIAALEHSAGRLNELHKTLYLRVAKAEADITVWRANESAHKAVPNGKHTV